MKTIGKITDYIFNSMMIGFAVFLVVAVIFCFTQFMLVAHNAFTNDCTVDQARYGCINKVVK